MAPHKELLVSAALQQSSIVGLECSTHRASNLLCCSACCVTRAGTTTLPSLGTSDTLQDSTQVWSCQRDGFLHTTAATTRHTPEPCLGEQSPCRGLLGSPVSLAANSSFWKMKSGTRKTVSYTTACVSPMTSYWGHQPIQQRWP